MATTLNGRLDHDPLSTVVREIHLARSTGVLELQVRGQKRRLHFRDGELHLAGSHPLARKLAAALADRTEWAPADAAARSGELKALILRMVEVTAEWQEGEYSFLEDPTLFPDDLVGPIPTLDFIMDSAVARLKDRDIVSALGGERVPWSLGGASTFLSRPALFSPAELWVIEQLRAPRSIKELLAESPMAREELCRALVRLEAIGCIQPADREAVVRDPRPTGPRPDDQVLARFDQRIRKSLGERPMELPNAEHRERVIDLLAGFAGMTYYELLGIGASAPIDEVQSAYESIARLVHPVHAEILGLESARNGLQLVFERATAAYLALADPERRKQYDVELGLGFEVVAGKSVQPVAQRAQEQREMARQHYEKALAYAAREDLHFAIELLQLAVKADPTKSQYFVDLARLQARNPNWLRHAAESYRRAIELAPRDLASRLLLAGLYEKLGDPVRARVQYHTVLRVAPENPDAAAALERLELSEADRGGGILGRLFRR